MFLKNLTRKSMLAREAVLCSSLLSRARGLMFATRSEERGVVLAFPEEQVIDLHMFFVFFPIDVLFLNKDKKVVEIKRHFVPFTTYRTRRKAKYAMELQAGTVERTKTKVGDRIGCFDIEENGKSKIIGVKAQI
jgi:uncharacterized protein